MFLKKRSPNIMVFLYLFLTTYFFIIFGAFFSTSHAAIVTPSEIPNLVIHYDAQDTDGDGNPANEPSNNNRIQTWVDKANGFDATQPVSNQRPKYTTTK
jgi:P pilus assembly chaperone PapD